MRIIIISDTHCRFFEELPSQLIDEIRKSDVVIHAGDYTKISLVEKLMELPKFVGVYGNMDEADVRMKLRPIEKIELGGVTIGISHPAEGGPPIGIESRIKKKLGDVRVVIYGHTHFPRIHEEGGTMYINPGSATGKFPARSRTYAVLTIDEKLEARIVSI